jgi:hypothetical protein
MSYTVSLVKYFLFFLLLFISQACNLDLESGTSQNLPQARGDNNEIIFVIDSAKRVGEVGQMLEEIFLSPFPGLFKDEPSFKARFVKPRELNNVLKLVKNLVYVSTLDDNSRGGRILLRNFTDKSLQRIKSNPDLFMFSRQNLYAKNQEVIHIFGNNDTQLLRNLEENQEQLRNHFYELERKRLMSQLYRSKENKKLGRQLLKDNSFTLRVPFGYDLAKTDSNFVWIRQYAATIDKNILIYFIPYESEEVFTPENIVALRNRMAYKHLRDIENPSVYMTTEERALPELEVFNFNEKYAVKTRWYWKLNNLSRGGAFVSYCFVDEASNRLYYIEGYVDSPGVDKRNSIVELETILSTFLTKDEVDTRSKKENA